jgi:ribosome maturation factor RimP
VARGPRLKVGFAAHLFFDQMQIDRVQNDIEERLARLEPDVEVLAVERAGAERVRLFIDHPGGVDLALCERVTGHLRDMLVDFGLEVSSPGPQRPLTKPGRGSFTGQLVGASDQEVTVAADDGVVSIPYAEIGRSNLVEEGR